jgi:sugar lactone lactonase YvrE
LPTTQGPAGLVHTFVWNADADIDHRIRAVGPYDRDTATFSSGATIRTVAGNGVAREELFSGSVNPIRPFHQPYGLDIDPRDGALYFSTEFGSRIYRLDLGAKRVSRIAGGERNSSVGDGHDAADVRLRAPTSLRLDAFGNIYTADSSNHRIRRFHPEPD